MPDSWLRRARRNKGQTLAEFARDVKASCGKGTVGNLSRIERGLHNPTISLLRGIATVLGKRIDFIEDKIRQDYHGKEKG